MARKKSGNLEILVPAAVFSDRNLSFSEALVSYLWIEHRLSPSQIGKMLAMDRRNVWTIMSRASKKAPQIELRSKRNIFIPVVIFTGRKVSVQESIVGFLRDKVQLSNKEVADILSRSEKTVWTAYSRYKAKRGERK